MAETALVHYPALKKYLETHLLKEQGGVSKQRESARNKLKGLSQQHFQELSTDVYDEMSRRVLDSVNVPFLPVRDDFHPKRNQARQKLATLPTTRFKDLASDVFYELSRRYPEIEPEGANKKESWQSDENLSSDRRDGNNGSPSYTQKDAVQQNNRFQNDSFSVQQSNLAEPSRRPSKQTSPSTQPPPSTSNATSPGFLHSPTSTGSSPRNASFSQNKHYNNTANSNNANITNSQRAPEPLTTIVPKQQTATVQRAAPAYTVQKNSYEEGSSSSSVGHSPDYDEQRRRSSSGAESVIFSVPPSTESKRRSSEFDTGYDRQRNVQEQKKSGFSIDNLISNASGANSSAQGGSNKSGEAPVNLSNLDTLMADLGNMIRPGEHAQSEAYGNESKARKGSVDVANDKEYRWLKNKYEGIVEDLTKKIARLEADSKNSALPQLETELMQLRDINAQQSRALGKLQNENDELLDDVKILESAAEELRKENARVERELKDMIRKYDELWNEKEKDVEAMMRFTEENARLRKELDNALSKASNHKAPVSPIRSPSLAKPPAPASFTRAAAASSGESESLLTPREDGQIEPQRINAYQAAVDDLLRAGRSDTPTAVLMAMKAIVLSCKDITSDIERYENILRERNSSSPTTPSTATLANLKSRFSNTLSSLMTTTKNHATGYGASPIGLLDASAGNLTAAVVDIVRALKLKKVNGQTLASASANNGASASVPAGRSRGLSTSSPSSASPKSPMARSDRKGSYAQSGRSTYPQPQDSGATTTSSSLDESFDVEDLKLYLEQQTDSIVQAIQTLLHAMRQTEFGQELSDTITTITEIVDASIRSSRETFSDRHSGARYKARGEMILRDLEASNVKLAGLRDALMIDAERGGGGGGGGGKPTKQSLASASFEIARYVKELVGLID